MFGFIRRAFGPLFGRKPRRVSNPEFNLGVDQGYPSLWVRPLPQIREHPALRDREVLEQILSAPSWDANLIQRVVSDWEARNPGWRQRPGFGWGPGFIQSMMPSWGVRRPGGSPLDLDFGLGLPVRTRPMPKGLPPWYTWSPFGPPPSWVTSPYPTVEWPSPQPVKIDPTWRIPHIDYSEWMTPRLVNPRVSLAGELDFRHSELPIDLTEQALRIGRRMPDFLSPELPEHYRNYLQSDESIRESAQSIFGMGEAREIIRRYPQYFPGIRA